MAEISFDSEREFSLPDRYVLICNASGAPNANLAPIYQLGKERIAAIAINCGVADRRQPTEQEQRSAIDPASWLADFARDRLGLSQESIRIFDGDADNFCEWASIGKNSAVGWAHQFGLPVLANFQGGTTQMSMGLAQALIDSDLDWMRLFLGKFPALAHISVRIGGEIRDWINGTPVENVPLDILLEARGYERFDDPQTKARSKFAVDHGREAARLMQRFKAGHYVSKDERRSWLAALSGVNRACSDDKGRQYPFNIADSNGSVASHYEEPLGAAFWAGGNVHSDEHRHFLAGGWLEQGLFDKISRRVADRRGWRVEANLSIRRTSGTSAVNEIDIVLMQDEMLHLIEVKSGRDLSDLQEWGDKLVKLNRILAGRPARSWIVAPSAWIESEAERLERTERLAKSGVTLLLGDRAIKALLKEIDQLNFG